MHDRRSKHQDHRSAHPAGADVVHYRAVNLEPDTWSRFLAVCICTPGVDMITMLEPEEIAARDHLRVAPNQDEDAR